MRIACKAIIFRTGSLFSNATVGSRRTELSKLFYMFGSEPGLKIDIQNLGFTSLNQMPKYCLFERLWRLKRAYLQTKRAVEKRK